MNTNFTKMLPPLKSEGVEVAGKKSRVQSTPKMLNAVQTHSNVRVGSYEELVRLATMMEETDSGHAFDKYESLLTEKEAAIDRKWNQLRNKINGTIASSLSVENGLSAVPFYDALKFINEEGSEEQELYSYIQAMPKGGNLHIHTSATYEIRSFLKDLLSGIFQDNVYVMMSDFLYYSDKTGQTNKVLKGTLVMLLEPPTTYGVSLEICKPLKNLTKQEKETLYQLLTLADNQNDYIENIPYIWDGFNDVFSRISEILCVPPIYQDYYQGAFRTLAEDHVNYCELRCGVASYFFADNSYLFGNDIQKEVFDEADPLFIRLLKNAYQAVFQKYNGFQLKLVFTANRGAGSMESSFKKLRLTYEWMNSETINENPCRLPGVTEKSEFILGFDLVSEEDRGAKTQEFMKYAYEQEKGSLYLANVPFYFHDGESNRYDDDNLFSAYLMGSRRIGHGLNLYRFPYLQEMVEMNNMALEVCPISNQVLRYIPDLRMHPVFGYLKQGLPCVICSDDPQILGNPGLSYDFFMLYISGNLTLKGMKRLIKNSYEYSGMNEEETKVALELWETEWEKFVDNMSL